MVPSIGRIVHYVISDGAGFRPSVVGQHRAAIIARVWDANPGSAVDLQVFTDGFNDREDGKSVVWVTSVAQDDNAESPGSWHQGGFVKQ